MTIARGIAMEWLLLYDVSQEQCLFDKDGLMIRKALQCNSLKKNLKEEDKKLDFKDQSFKSFRQIKLQELKILVISSRS